MNTLRASSCVLLALTFLVSVFVYNASADQLPPSHNRLPDLVEEALQHNAQLRAAESRWRMYSYKVSPASALADPRLSVAFSSYPVDSLASDSYAMTGNELKLEQALPFPGKLSLKGEVAEQQARWYEAMYRDQRGEVVRQVRDLWYQLYYLDHALELVDKNLQVLDQLTRLSETRFAVGKGMQQDVLRAQLQQSKLTDRRLALQQQREAARAQLNAVLSRDSGDFVTTGDDESLSPLPDVDAAIADIRSRRPMFRAYDALVEQYQASKRLAERDYYPDFGVWASYRFRDDNLPDGGEDFVSAGFSLNLPFYLGKRRAAVAGADAGVSMAHQQYQEVLDRTISELRRAGAELEKNRNLVLLYRTGIIPQAQQSFDAELNAYQVGKVTFLELMDSLAGLYNYQLEYYRSLSDYRRVEARFKQLSGSESSLYDIDPPPVEDRKQP